MIRRMKSGAERGRTERVALAPYVLPVGAQLLGVLLVGVLLLPAVHGAEPAAAPPKGAAPAAAKEAGITAGIEAASNTYSEAFDAHDLIALADQWTTDAELVEGGSRLSGRERIMESLGAWLNNLPEAKLSIKLTEIRPLGPTVARVSGIMRFSKQRGARPVETRFESLRVLENGKWRLAESVVEPSQAYALDDLDWLIGSWTASDAVSGRAYEARYERVAGGHAILGRTTIHTAPPANQSTPSGNPRRLEVIEAIDLIHPDKVTGAVRSWLFDSTGARAEGLFETDGVAFNRSFTGSTADGASAKVSRWVQVLVPTGEESMTLQSIDRTLDGRPLPDGQPIHFKKSK